MANRGRPLHGKRWGRDLNDLLRQPPTGIEQWMLRHTELLKFDRGSLVGLLTVRQHRCFLKLYKTPSRWRRLLYFLRLGRPLRAYRAGQRLASLGITVPCPLSCMLVPEGALVLAEAVPGGRNLNELWLQQPTPGEAQSLMRAAADVMALMHRKKHVHGDCKWSNLVWDGQQFFLVDLDAVRRPRWPLLNSRRARDVARFTVNAEEMGVDPEVFHYFMHRYLARTGQRREKLVRRMQRHLRRYRARHMARYGVRGRPLL